VIFCSSSNVDHLLVCEFQNMTRIEKVMTNRERSWIRHGLLDFGSDLE
jgi:hypothetical protein